VILNYYQIVVLVNRFNNMKKVLIAFAFLFLGLEAFACDACGCAATGSYSGIYPQFSKNLFGIRYGFTEFTHPNTTLNYNGDSRVYKDYFQRFEAWGRFYPSDKVQLFVFVPYQVHRREEERRATEISGVGDITILANYALVNTGDSLDRKFNHTLLLGGGFTLPTGKYQERDEGQQMLPAQFQIGTGAYSLSTQLNYTIRHKGFGINTELSYTFRDVNERSYRFGESANMAISGFYWITTEKMAILPNVGWSYEEYQHDLEYGQPKAETGGNMQFLNLGVDINYRRLFLRGFIQNPLSQDLPDSQPTSGVRWNASVSYVF